MGKSMSVTWLGDADPNQQLIHEGGVRFIKGEATKVPVDVEFNGIPWANNFRGNPMFAVDEKADVVDSDEAEQPEEAGTERAAVRAELKALGVEVRGNPSIETLRDRLAAETAKSDL